MRTVRRHRRSCTAVLLGLAVVVSACSGDDGPTAQQPASRSPAPVGSATPAVASGASDLPVPGGPPPALALKPVAKLDQPVAMAVRPGSSDLFVLEQAGAVRHIAVTGTPPAAQYSLDPKPWLDLTPQVLSGGERGLLGMAFAPDGKHVYFSYTGQDTNQHLIEMAIDVSGAVLADTQRTVLSIDDFAPNHNGGQLAFGPDGFLYWGMGDGGGGGDPHSTGQNPDDLLGDVLRIDPRGDPYAVPADNPFVSGGGAPEVFAYGLRNPWRFSFDAANGDLWIGDVGQDKVEEVDRLAGGRPFGANFGWNTMEGTHPYKGSPAPGALPPVFDYTHDDGSCSVIAGFAYRGTAIPGLEGTFLFGDYCTPPIRGLRPDQSGGYEAVDLGLAVSSLTSFGQGADHELYTLSLDGDVSLLAAA